jgi:hypothetical protein
VDEGRSEDAGELKVDDPAVLDLIKFLDEFDSRIEAHKRSLTAHYPAAVAHAATGRRLNDLMHTVVDMRQAVTQLRSDIRNTRRIEYPVICDRLTEILKIGV